MQNPFKNVKPFMSKHEPELLMSVGIVGLIFSTGWAIFGTYKSIKAVQKYKAEKNIDKVTAKEVFKLTWKYYIPVILVTAGSVPCIIAGNRISNKRMAALTTAYTVSQTALQEFKDATKEVVGEKKADQIQDKANEKRVNRTYDSSKILLTGEGNNLFYEPLSARYFRSTWNAVQKACNELNSEVLSGTLGYISLNEWFTRLGLKETDAGDILGWELRGDPSNIIKIDLTSMITEDGNPCACIKYKKEPDKLTYSAY